MAGVLTLFLDVLQLDQAKQSDDRIAEHIHLREVLSLLERLVTFAALQQDHIHDAKQQLSDTNVVLADVTAWSQTQANSLKEAQEAKQQLQQLIEVKEAQLKDAKDVFATVRPEAEKWACERSDAVKQLAHAQVHLWGDISH